MITLIVCAYNYFIWLFTGHIPMEHLAINPLWILGVAPEFLIEVALLNVILEVVLRNDN